MAKNTPSEQSADIPETPAAEVAAAGKGKATPSRKEQEEARKRPLVPNDRKAAVKASRAKLNEQRERARIGMANGEERYLPLRDKGPQKRYVRDFVDARFSAGEILLPLMFLVIVSYFFEAALPWISYYALIAVWGFIFLVVIDCVALGWQLKRRLTAKFGADKLEKFRWYATMRAVQMRVLRLPKPMVKRGQYPA